MQKKILASLLIFFFLIVNTNVSATNLAFINLDNVLKNSDLGIKTLNKIEKKKNLKQKKKNNKEKKIKKLDEEIKKKKKKN